jgi:hypothetical protein
MLLGGIVMREIKFKNRPNFLHVLEDFT